MTPEIQREAIGLLAEVWALSPDVRLGQLLAHLGFLGEAHVNKGLGYIEDDELIAILCRHRSELMARHEGAPHSAVHSPGCATSTSGSSIVPEGASDSLRDPPVDDDGLVAELERRLDEFKRDSSTAVPWSELKTPE